MFAFLPLVVVGYYTTARLMGPGAARIWLCAASLVFYAWWKPVFVLLMVGSITFNYALSRALGGDHAARRQDVILFSGIASNVLLLFYYKYLFALLWFVHDIGWWSSKPESIILPLGISFFTFTQIGYLVDCRQDRVSERGFINYVLFVTFFPHLIAGPILHHREIMPQFARTETYRFSWVNLSVGLTLFAVGLAKKVLLADTLAPSVELSFSQLQQIPLLQAWAAALGYSMQLYFDFSGYCDMAIGIAILFGIRLPLNFNSPYQSLNIIDFWQRWHITLTRYVTLLIYNPLALWVARSRQRAGLSIGRRAAVTPTGFLTLIAFPTFVTILIAGIWHGAALTFVMYGLLHAVYLIINHAWRLFRRPLVARAIPPRANGWSVTWRWALTYSSVLLAQIIFRSPNVLDAMSLIQGMLGIHGIGHMTASWFYHLAFTLGLAMIAFACSNVYQFLGRSSPALTPVKPMRWRECEWRPDVRLAGGVGILLAVTVLLSQRATQFLYFQF